ncbi:Alcohol acetyltransferase [Cytospora paraplurivora]|uniref:Alcohol acetyltransferase n=1 Tax=Cytospora paraplurivora TaxID=2898453 RepID=A0AAN9UCK0_9PEZI
MGVYRGLANACQYAIAKEHLQGRLIQTLVEEALARLVLRLGGLRVGIIREDTDHASFVRVPSLNILDFIQWKTVTASTQTQYDSHILDAIRDKLEQLWPDIANRPPWKLLVIQNERPGSEEVVINIVFTVHHAVADGKSTSLFHTLLLQELNSFSGPPPELRNHILTFSQPPVLAPSQEELVHVKIGWMFFFKTLWGEFGPAWLKPTPPAEPWRGKAITLEPHKLELRLIAIQPAVVSSLISACRVHGASLNGVFHILILASLARRVPPDVAPAFSGETPISLLPWAKLPPDVSVDLSKTLTVLNTGTKKVWGAETVDRLRAQFGVQDDGLEADLIWPLAAEWRAEVRAKVASLPNDDVVGLLPWVKDWQKRWKDKIGQQRDATWEISNIGSVTRANSGVSEGWRIQRSFFTQPALVAGAGFGVNVTGVEGGEVTLVLNWQETVIDAKIVDGVVEDLSTWIEGLGKTGKFGIFSQNLEY